MSGGSERGRDSKSAFRAYLTQDWERWLSEYPELATVLGFPGQNDRWTDDSEAGIERRRRHLVESQAGFREFDGNSLPAGERLNYDTYRGLLRTAEAGLAFGYEPIPYDLGQPHNLWMPVNQLEGIHISAPELLALAPHETLRDYEDLLRRLHGLPAAIEQNLSLLEIGRKRGYTPPRVAVQGVPDQVQNLLRHGANSNPLLSSFGKFPASLGDSDRARLAKEAQLAVTDHIVPALERLHDYLRSKYLPACRDSIAASVLPDGAAAYEFLVRKTTTTDLAAAQIHEIGLAEVGRLRAEMESVMRGTGFAGSFAEFKEFLRTDRRFYWSKADELVDGYRVIAKRVDPELGRLFGRLPRLPYGVMPVPAYREATSPAAYYVVGAPSTGRAGTFYASTYRVEVRPRWEMEALTLHEAVPGHHLQLALAQELDHLPEFRRETGPTAFVEGWGLYAESLGEELGCYQDPYSKLGQLTFDMWRSIRLVVDTGMHALGWTRDQAIQFFREHTGMSDIGITVEVDRYIVWPGQALAYKMGQLKIRELRTFAERQLASRFDVRAFHDLVLGEGALPLDVLESRVRGWVAAQSAA